MQLSKVLEDFFLLTIHFLAGCYQFYPVLDRKGGMGNQKSCLEGNRQYQNCRQTLFFWLPRNITKSGVRYGHTSYGVSKFRMQKIDCTQMKI